MQRLSTIKKVYKIPYPKYVGESFVDIQLLRIQ